MRIVAIFVSWFFNPLGKILVTALLLQLYRQFFVLLQTWIFEVHCSRVFWALITNHPTCILNSNSFTRKQTTKMGSHLFFFQSCNFFTHRIHGTGIFTVPTHLPWQINHSCRCKIYQSHGSYQFFNLLFSARLLAMRLGLDEDSSTTFAGSFRWSTWWEMFKSWP